MAERASKRIAEEACSEERSRKKRLVQQEGEAMHSAPKWKGPITGA
jgi:hypothetical protein